MKNRIWLKEYFKSYKFNSLFFKNCLMLMLLIFVPITGTILLSYYAYNNMQKKEIYAYSEKIMSDVSSDLERILKKAQTELAYFGFHSDVELFMYDDAINEHNYKVKTIQNLIKMPILTTDYVRDVYIYSEKSKYIISLLGVADFSNFIDRELLEIYQNQGEKKRNLLLLPSSSQGYERKYLTVFQKVQYGKQQNGINMMKLDPEKVIEELSLPENATVFVTDGDSILLSKDENFLGKSIKEIPNYTALDSEELVLDNFYCTSSLKLMDFDLQIILRVNLGEYQNQLSSVRNGMTLFLMVIIFLTLIQALWISIKLYRPIEKIANSIQEFSSVLVGENEIFGQKNELEYILNSIQKSVVEKKSVDEELTERLRLLKRAQAVALQSQINPHFLNNTLETINWTAIELLGRKNEISEMTGGLAKMLRMTLENSDTVVAIREEVQHCKYYLEIQQKRYEDKFEVIWKIPEDVLEYKIIRIILQPLVENAIYHGIKPLSEKGILVISGSMHDEEVELSVSDTGLGMTEEELTNLRHNMANDMIKESKHIGVTNVNQRIKLYFGEEYGVSIESKEGVGTKATVHIPRVVN